MMHPCMVFGVVYGRYGPVGQVRGTIPAGTGLRRRQKLRRRGRCPTQPPTSTAGGARHRARDAAPAVDGQWCQVYDTDANCVVGDGVRPNYLRRPVEVPAPRDAAPRGRPVVPGLRRRRKLRRRRRCPTQLPTSTGGGARARDAAPAGDGQWCQVYDTDANCVVGDGVRPNYPRRPVEVPGTAPATLHLPGTASGARSTTPTETAS